MSETAELKSQLQAALTVSARPVNSIANPSNESPAEAVSVYQQANAALEKIGSGAATAVDLCQYLDALARLGLGAPARLVLQRLDWSNPAWQTARAALEPEVASLPAGTVPWRSRRRRFEANLDTLLRRWPMLASLRSVAEALPERFLLCQAADGNYHIYDQKVKLHQAWGRHLADHRLDVQRYRRAESGMHFVAPLAFDGLGLGYLFLKLMALTEHTYLQYSCMVYAVEPDLRALAILLHLHDFQAVLRDPRLRLCAGRSAETMYSEALEEPGRMLPELFVDQRLLPRPSLELESMARLNEAGKIAELKIHHDQIAQRYAGRDAAWWHRRYCAAADGSEPPLRVLGLTTRFSTVLQHTMSELGRAITAAGQEFRFSLEINDNTLARDDIKHILDFEPDLIIIISRARHENTHLPRDIPVLTWDQDNLPCMRHPRTREGLNALTYIAGMGALDGYRLFNWPARNCIFTHLAAATRRYSNEPAPAELLARYRCDFSYVSHAAQPVEEIKQQMIAQWQADGWGDVFTPVCEHVAGLAAPQFSPQQAEVLITAHAAKLGRSLPPGAALSMGHNLAHLEDRMFRHQALEWVVKYCRERGATLKLFGTGWDKHPRFSKYACGPLEPGEHARAAYQATRINLQLLLGGFLHSRPLDGLAAGGFFLTRTSNADRDLAHGGSAVACHEMAVRALELGLHTYEALKNSSDPVIRRTFPVYDEYTFDWMRERTATTLREYSEQAPAEAFFPMLQAISFGSEQEFITLADRYLADDELRGSTARAMRDIGVRQFSYDARWRVFLRDITNGLAVG